jgi:predicted MFS family arabinose efflux permease
LLALSLLIAINLFNYIDRYVLAAVEPEIRKELFPDPAAGAFAKTQMGMLSTAFLLTYMATAPIFGALAHRFSRWWLIGVGVILWSLASGASGLPWGGTLSHQYWALFVTRCFVGIGEAAYGPIAPALLADMYPVERRGKILSYFYLAIPVGSALGYTLGGEVGKSPLQWRGAFYLVVPPGILLGVLCFLMSQSKTKASAAMASTPRLGWTDYRSLWHTPSYVYNTLGMAAMTFALGGLAFWMPAYLEWRKDHCHEVVTVWGLDARTFFGGLTVVAGLLATLAGGWAGDWLRPRFPGSYFIVSGGAMLLGFPMLLLMIYLPFPLAWVFVFLAVFLLFFNTGPTNTILANVTPPAIRAAGFAVNIFIIHILGDVPSPPLMGWIADHYNQNVSFLLVSLLVLVGGMCWLCGAKHLERDTIRASAFENGQ